MISVLPSNSVAAAVSSRLSSFLSSLSDNSSDESSFDKFKIKRINIAEGKCIRYRESTS